MIKKPVLKRLIVVLTIFEFIFMLSFPLVAYAQEEKALVPSEILGTLTAEQYDKSDLFFNLVIVLIIAVIFLVVLMGTGLIVYSVYTYAKNHLFKKKDVKTHDVS